MHQNHLGGLLNRLLGPTLSCFLFLFFVLFFKQDRYSLITYISNKFPGNANAAGPRTALWGPLIYLIQGLPSLKWLVFSYLSIPCILSTMLEHIPNQWSDLLIKDFPGGPMAKAPCFQCRVRFLVRELSSHMLHGTAKKYFFKLICLSIFLSNTISGNLKYY